MHGHFFYVQCNNNMCSHFCSWLHAFVLCWVHCFVEYWKSVTEALFTSQLDKMLGKRKSSDFYLIKNVPNGQYSIPVVPKLGVICSSSGGNAEPKPLRCSELWAITGKEIFDMKCDKFSLRVIRYNRYIELGNGSNKFGNHCSIPSSLRQTSIE